MSALSVAEFLLKVRSKSSHGPERSLIKVRDWLSLQTFIIDREVKTCYLSICVRWKEDLQNLWNLIKTRTVVSFLGVYIKLISISRSRSCGLYKKR